ncbi:MAG: hypothetical protein JWL77_6111 [Chthonomonadaceae bacterium]|nr:hypothetical protein [Chthonomonadaceae bacterium]
MYVYKSANTLYRFCALISLVCTAAIASRAYAAETGSAPRVVSYPPSTQLDFRSTLEAPAGKHGFLSAGSNGHFYFADGKRARFWGINVSSTRLDIPPDQIERVVDNFARAGLNLVRLEAIDNRNCLLGKVDSPDSLHFDRRYQDRLDRWMDSLRRHGIYYYLDLLDFRTFKAGDNVLNAQEMDRGARPYALYDDYLIELQQDYAKRLLTHKNPYSGLEPVNDPALAMVEICNEHGFFLYPEKLETLAEPYRTDLRNRWNRWLKDHYGTRDKLQAAWGDINGFTVLRDDEDTERLSVDLPLLTRPLSATDPTAADILRAPTRLHDGVQFLTELQRTYLRGMRDYILSLGLQVPVTAVVSNDVAPDVWSVAQECDFTAENWYGDTIKDDPRTPGMRYYSNRNPLREDGPLGVAPFTAGLRWNNKPVVIREWGTIWPNRYRAVSVPEMLAYASLQDYDAVLLFGYQTNRAPNGAEADALNDYAFQSDPTVWGLHAIAGQAFLNRAIRPADHTATLVYPSSHLYDWPAHLSELHRASWSVRIKSTVANSRPDAFAQIPTGTVSDVQSLRDVLNAIGKRGSPVSEKSLTTGVWRSDTGQITRYTHEGRIEISTPTLAILSGELDADRLYTVGSLHVKTANRFGTIIAYSLDGLPLVRSKHRIIKMVTRAENSDELLERAPKDAPAPWQLTTAGTGPVVTFGSGSTSPTKVWIEAQKVNGKPVPLPLPMLTMDMIAGTWEIELVDGTAHLHCDTVDIHGTLHGRDFTTADNAVVMKFEKKKLAGITTTTK